MSQNKITIKKFQNLFVSQFTHAGFTQYEPVSLLSKAFPTNFTPSGGEEHLERILVEKNPKESFCTIQPCFRYQDIERISTDIHMPLFEMGVAISVNQFSFEEMVIQFLKLFDLFNLDRKRLVISIFKGEKILDKNLPFDFESLDIWRKHGIKESQFEYLGEEDNYFVLKKQGYAGVKTEVFYNTGSKLIEIGVLIRLTHSVLEDHKERYYLDNFDDEVVCMGVGSERWSMIINRVESIADIAEFSKYLTFFNELKKSRPNDSKHNPLIFIFLLRSLLFLYKDGAMLNKSNRGRSSLLRKTLKKLLATGKENWLHFTNQLSKMMSDDIHLNGYFDKKTITRLIEEIKYINNVNRK